MPRLRGHSWRLYGWIVVEATDALGERPYVVCQASEDSFVVGWGL